MTNHIYVLENFNGPQAVFNSVDELIKFTTETAEDEMFACAVIKFNINSDEWESAGDLIDYMERDEKMKYEYKEYIRDEILSNINHMNILDDALEELDHVYAQAAKADEYKAKAKAFDRIVEERNQAGTAMYGKDNDVVDRVIDRAFWDIDGIIVEYESGE